jgi:drug/metabolite transporter (DMT)-like permease
MKYKEFLPLISLGAAFVLWGCSGAIFKLGLQTMDPFIFGYLRFIMASFIIGFILLISKKLSPLNHVDSIQIMSLSFFGVFVKIALLLFALPHISAVLVSLIFASVPIIAYMLSLIVFKEKFIAKTCIGMCVAAVGLLIAITATSTTTFVFNGYVWLMLLSMLLEVWFLLASKKSLSHIEPLNYTFYTFVVAAICFFPFAYGMIIAGAAVAINQVALSSLLYAVIGSSVLAYFLYGYGLKHTKSTKASVLIFLDPVSAFIIAPLLLKEQTNAMQIIGICIVIIGVYIAEHTFLHIHGHNHGVHKMK